MNGAAPLPPKNTSRPRRSITARIGSSHHFLFCFRNSQNSPTRPSRFSLASRAISSSCDTATSLSPLRTDENSPAGGWVRASPPNSSFYPSGRRDRADRNQGAEEEGPRGGGFQRTKRRERRGTRENQREKPA